MVAAELSFLFVYAFVALVMAPLLWSFRPAAGAKRGIAMALWALWGTASVAIAGWIAAQSGLEPVLGGAGWLALSGAACYLFARLAPVPPPKEVPKIPEPTEEWLNVELSDVASKAIKDKLAPGELLLTMPADITAEGAFGSRILVVKGDTLAVMSLPGHRAQVDFEVTLADITGASSEALVGGGALEISIKGRRRQIVRYTNAHIRDYAQVARKINDYVKARDGRLDGEGDDGGEADAAKENSGDRARLSFLDIDRSASRKCPGCGRSLGEETSVCPRCVDKTKVLRRLFGLSWPHRRSLLVLAALMLAGTFLLLLPPYLTKVIIDDVLMANGGTDLLLLVVMGLVMIRVLNTVFATLRGRLSISVGARVTLEVRSKCFHHVQRLSLSYFDKQKVGGLMSRLNSDTRQLQNFLVEGVQFTVINALQLAGIIVAMLWLNWRLALVVFFPAPFVVVGWGFYMHRLHRLWGRMWHRMQRFGSFLNDSLRGVRVVKAFGQEKREITRFDGEVDTLMHSVVDAEGTWALLAPPMQLLMESGALLIWYFGGRQVLAGSIGLGTLVAFFGYLGMFYGPLAMVTRLNHWLAHTMTAAERVFEVLDTEPDIVDNEDVVAMPNARGDIELRNASFSYDKIKPVLKDVSLKVEAGEMIGLVGHSGAGKSTTINLICRLYDVDDGQILLDGVDVKNIRVEDLRRQIGVVLQETFLFSGSIAENIAYGRPVASAEEMMQAATAANAHDFIMKRPDGYESQIGEGGDGLSGGEKQRIAIARAILHDPKILILDEATSAVDTETERQIQEALARLVKGRTTFAIAHRLSTLRNANRLLVLENGKRAELGTHEELIEKDGTYAKLVRMQTEMNRIIAVRE